nr:immunoglobulin heavy chain junction region [Mus musculus]
HISVQEQGIFTTVVALL